MAEDDRELTEQEKEQRHAAVKQFGESTLRELEEREYESLYGPEAIDQLLGALVANQHLTYQEATDIRNLMGDDTSVVKAAGYIAGEFNVSPKDIEKVANNTAGVTIKASQVEEQKRNFLRTAGDVGSTVATPFWAVRDWLSDVTGVEGIRGDGFFSDEKGLAGAIIDTEEEAKEKRDRADLRDRTRGVIDHLNAQGYITDGQATKMKSVTDNYNASTYQDLYDEISEIVEGFEFTTMDEAVWVNTTLGDLRERSKMVSDGPAGLDDEEATPEVLDDVEDPLEAAAGQANTFDDLLALAGVVSEQQVLPDPAERETIDYLYVDGTRVNISDFQGTGPTGITDPATGSVMSNAQYQAILASDALKKRYAELGYSQGWNGAAALVYSGRFMPRDAKWTRDGRLYGIPEEDLGIRSAVVSEGWQAPLYDWANGQGQADWMAMSQPTRRAKVNHWVDAGLIREEEREYYETNRLAAGQMYEQITGVSRELQIDRWQATVELGGMATNIRQELRGGGGSGRQAPVYSVPASLRTIPDYKALATETRSIFRPTLGRDMEDWELRFLADELKERYSTRNDQLIQAHRAAWEDGVSGGTVNVDDIEVTDPASSLTYDIEDRYAPELERLEDVEEYGQNRQILMDSISMGQRVI